MTREEVVANLNMINVAFVEPVTKEQKKLIDDTFDMAIKALEQEPKTGRWIVHPKGIYAHLVCDKCLSCAPYDCRTSYCPNCGARMIEPQESEGEK